jgi:ubiquinone/menaquinone biosynthesis C-methylase UbiE
MATIEENQQFWNDRFHWGTHRGDVWSTHWGGPDAQWKWCVYPRIRQHLPTGTLLEIGPGMGRWTQFLRSFCKKLTVVELSPRCLEACRERFGDEGMEYHLGDGRSLGSLQDDSVDFTFSFESLIHSEADDLASYLQELARVMKTGGVCFLHHSNLGWYRTYYQWVQRFPKRLREFFQARGILDFDGWRALSVSHLDVKKQAEDCGFSLLSQELVPWGGKRLIDCFTVMVLGRTERHYQMMENHDFVTRAAEIARLARAYRPQA